ncbi:helix-turn-helix transcriptional regulator [Streptacidiphilus fuscans]|uniref:Helix-turn-helix transcriptional regulator n=1 Tax=Streptacidiphilus fuscans TaxID=2789292 RepID=A0A931B9J8_9ACTN|nr:helix-turn-helix transcriptional regulator [Streptacidiphilus fuscans]MBF9072037.1 helix-turn-helix transcriptional regulator [Streptacidiphilus fuscans]
MTASAGEVGLRRILAVVDLLIQAVDEDALLPALLPGLLVAIPAENVIWTTRPAPFRSVTYPAGLLTPDDHAVIGRYRTTDPLIRMTTGGPGVPLRRSDLQSWAEWHAQPIYTDVARRIGGEYQLAMELPVGGAPASSGNARSVCVALNRTGLDFSDDDVAAAALLRGRIRAALVRLERTGRIDEWSPCGGAGTAPTPREAAVLDLLALGLTDQQISRRLGISPRTVDKHLEHVYAKFAVHGRVEAANAWRGQHR